MFVTHLIDFLLPPRCPVSGEIVDSPGMMAGETWKALNIIDSPYCHKCGVPFDFDPGGAEALCTPCLAAPAVFHKARSALIYDDASRDLVLAFKHGDQLHMMPSLIPLLKRAGAELIERCDVIIPVPLHRWRLLRRRYNQAGVLAAGLARQVGKPAFLDGLVRLRATPTQGHLKATERAKNVAKAFAVNPARLSRIKDQSILLIDDVYTTGSTISECAKPLLAAGAREVNVLTLARVVKPYKI